MVDLTEELERRRLTNRRLLIATAVLSGLAVLGSLTLGYFRFQDSAKDSTLQCAREVAQPYTELRDQINLAAGDELDLLATASVQDRGTVSIEQLRREVQMVSERRVAAKIQLEKLGPQDERIAKEC